MAIGAPIDQKSLVEYMKDRSYKPIPSLLDMIHGSERWPLYVYYDHLGVRYVPRDHFYTGPRIDGPSDCLWIIPGSTP